MKHVFLLFFFSIVVGHAGDVRAAMLYLDIPQERYYEGDTFVAKIRLDNQGACMNAAEVNLRFPKDVVRAIDISRGESIFTLWVGEPVVRESDATISFSGGIPGGYCGRVAGDPGVSNILAKIVFMVPNLKEDHASESGMIRFLPGTKALLNDGLGTEASLTTQDREITVVASTTTPMNEWARELEKDAIPPEFFSLEVRQDASLFGNNYFIVFSTTDKQSGLDHYEVLEERMPRSQEGGGKATWKRIESPFMLADQHLKSLVRVKAVDKAGNERVAEYVPVMHGRTTPTSGLVAMIVLFIAAVFFAIHFIVRKKASS
ncbi:hypothetical protein A3C91_04015 [Candidatus Azambacteria bacterium RIFCSPHIGHO2_02_FULL_52_12]|uniref:Cohesin domain-containing protein n=1 Tax=Candidatus Azambacteria bacterium RIFCSPLOWO2_01_FULL_46_25 TaxID=1797298 RepID=A0A1F5BUW5_9BACT|nr:MAG: hypothetical protein A3C91_04015 [Candidatus Azambacteria bacterium RIFCSPHIGHO2_02_FULL_52_12]OGD34397.1 MAG: hypothetical protein A2988_02620 [Candidatus Azambacteria bacterium RIFCSPLOWO2_01_FULL_46_25]OGD37325.1 MAG: hypothetical protein A2850_01270 [Candidatus Azambacteria bacterium RIFCSPHIGHO2_01_FULL_51_74]